MCTVTNQTIVEDVLNNLVNKNEMFTAYDVTCQAKQEGADEPHRHMKGVIHSAWENGWFNMRGYDRKLIDVGMSIQPWLYYPQGADTKPYEDRFADARTKRDNQTDDSDDDGIVQPDSSFTAPTQNNDQSDLQTAVKKPTVVVSDSRGGTVVSTGSTQKNVTVKHGSMQKDPVLTENRTTDCDGRLNLTRLLLKQAGISYQGYVMVDYKENENVLRVYEIDRHTSEHAHYQVNKDYRVRVSPSKLKRLNHNTDVFHIKVFDNRIDISPGQ